MKKTLLFSALLVTIAIVGITHHSQFANAREVTKKKQVDYLDPNEFSVVACGISNEKWSMNHENYRSIDSGGVMTYSWVRVMLGVKTGWQKIENLNIQELKTKITLTSDQGDRLDSTEASMFKCNSFMGKHFFMIKASIHGAFPDTAKTITVEGHIVVICSDKYKQQTIKIPIKKETIKLRKGSSGTYKVKKKNSLQSRVGHAHADSRNTERE